MKDKIGGIFLIIEGLALGILYFLIPSEWLAYSYWAFVALFIIYGLYIYKTRLF